MTVEPSRLPQSPHRRHNPLLDEWVLVSPGRTDRPWQGAQDDGEETTAPRHDPGCYLCPGSRRAKGQVNPQYESTFIFTNDYPALVPEGQGESVSSGLFVAEPQTGTCLVVCFSPRHDVHLGDMARDEVRGVIDAVAEESAKLGSRYQWVQVFENRGEMMGASNPHPHGQIWAADSLPVEPAREDTNQSAYFHKHGRPLLLDYGETEAEGPRQVLANEDWLVVVPFWAIWPFETLVLPRAPVTRLPELEGHRRDSLADTLRLLISAYDRLFARDFPYSMGWHGAPFTQARSDHWALHAHFYPPLLRSAVVRKFMVGYELLAEPQRDISPEEAAVRLRSMVEGPYGDR